MGCTLELLTARSGSFRPFPVQMQTILLSWRSNPWRCIFTKPANDAADAGSQKMPSLLANIR